MSRVAAASLALLIIAAPAGVAVAADAQANAAPTLTQAEAKRLSERLIALKSQLDTLQEQRRTGRAAYKSSYGSSETRDISEALLTTNSVLPTGYTVLPVRYGTRASANAKAGVGYQGTSMARRMKAQRLLRIEGKINSLTGEHDVISDRLAAHRAGV